MEPPGAEFSLILFCVNHTPNTINAFITKKLDLDLQSFYGVYPHVYGLLRWQLVKLGDTVLCSCKEFYFYNSVVSTVSLTMCMEAIYCNLVSRSYHKNVDPRRSVTHRKYRWFDYAL